MLREMQIGQGRADALRALGERTNVPDVRTLRRRHGAGRLVRHPGRPGAARAVRRDAGQASSARRGEGPAGPGEDHHPADLLHPPDPVHRGHGTGRDQHHGQLRDEPGRPPAAPVALAARAFVLVALLGPAVWTQDDRPCSRSRSASSGRWPRSAGPRRSWCSRPVDAALVGAVCGLTATSIAVLGALAVPPFTAGLYRGVRVALACRPWRSRSSPSRRPSGLSAQASGRFSWNMTGLGLGLVGIFLHAALNAPTRSRPTTTRRA